MTSLALWLLWAMMQSCPNCVGLEHFSAMPNLSEGDQIQQAAPDQVCWKFSDGTEQCFAAETVKLYIPRNAEPIPHGGGCPTCGIDVPAIQVKGAEPVGFVCVFNDDIEFPMDGEKCNEPWHQEKLSTAPVWTCADKSRVLLTDEKGGRHCVKF